MTVLEIVKTTMKLSFPSHIIIHTKSRPSLKTLMRMVEMMPFKSVDFKWLTIA